MSDFNPKSLNKELSIMLKPSTRRRGKLPPSPDLTNKIKVKLNEKTTLFFDPNTPQSVIDSKVKMYGGIVR